MTQTTALSNTYAGFDLVTAQNNCFSDCKAIATGEGIDQMKTQVFGFVSEYGYGNIFERCIANATQALSATDVQSIVAGFALRGTEQQSKIINSEAAIV